MRPLYNGMLPPGMIRRLADLWPDITKDSDFSDERRYAGPPPKAARLLLGNSNPAEL